MITVYMTNFLTIFIFMISCLMESFIVLLNYMCMGMYGMIENEFSN